VSLNSIGARSVDVGVKNILAFESEGIVEFRSRSGKLPI
jgi:hypothetical protein